MASHPKQQLSALGAKNKGAGRHLDGDNLYLVVDPSGARRWVLRITIRGKRRDVGLGGLRTVSLASARTKAAMMREMIGAGGDPRVERATAKARQVTFQTFAEEYIKIHRSEWTSDKHAAQWTSTLTTHAYPVIGNLFVAEVDMNAIVTVLRPIWLKTPETASRLRARLETILDAAKSKGLRSGDNPAVWAGGLQASLPKDKRKARVVHHAAMPYRDLAAFLARLDDQPGNGALALRFTILNCSRTNEVIGARWSEFDLEEAVWIIPKSRMKAKKEHRVPLCKAALELLEGLPRTSDFVFPGRKPENPMSNMTMSNVLERMGIVDATVHGFRSTFRDWAGEQTLHMREVIEHALAHQLADESEAAYQRGDLLQKRRALMEDWSRFCATQRSGPADVVSIKKKIAA